MIKINTNIIKGIEIRKITESLLFIDTAIIIPPIKRSGALTTILKDIITRV